MVRRSHDDALGVAGADTVIGTGVTVTGNLSSEADIIIDGSLDGAVKAGGNVTIGVNAIVKGDIDGTNVTVGGQIYGNISASGEATIRETGQVKGDIKAIGLVVVSGGIFIGRSIMEAPPQLEHSDSLTPSDET